MTFDYSSAKIFAGEVYEKVDGYELCEVGTRSVTFAGIPSMDGYEDLPAFRYKISFHRRLNYIAGVNLICGWMN